MCGMGVELSGGIVACGQLARSAKDSVCMCVHPAKVWKYFDGLMTDP